MLELTTPGWLLGLPVLALVWWLHRLRSAGTPVAVAALFLWRDSRQQTSSGLALARRADPLWLLRAAIVAALLIALAEPQWVKTTAPIVVWLDDSVSMQAMEEDSPRWQVANETLLTELNAIDASQVTLRSLGDPAASLRLDGPASLWPESIEPMAWRPEPRRTPLAPGRASFPGTHNTGS